MVTKTHKIKLDLSNKQKAHLDRFMGAARWVYNNTKQINEDFYKEQGKSLSKYDLRNKIVQELKPQNTWLREIPKGVTIYAAFQYHEALTRFFKGQSKYPKFHKKKSGTGSFSIENDKVKLQGKRLRLPHLGWITMRESLRFEGKLKKVTVTQRNHQYYVSLTVETETHSLPQTGGIIGVDVNLHDIVDSEANHYQQPRAYRTAERRLKRLQREVSRKQKGSQNRKKAIRRLANAHERVANIRRDFAHKLSYQLVKDNSIIAIEDLNVKGMLVNHKLAKHIQDAGFAQFLTNIRYKSLLHERELVIANRFYPSSKTCSSCGVVRTKLSLAERVFICNSCGVALDRDENAALNLYKLAVDFTERKNACGEDIRLGESNLKQQSSMKQELITTIP